MGLTENIEEQHVFINTGKDVIRVGYKEEFVGPPSSVSTPLKSGNHYIPIVFCHPLTSSKDLLWEAFIEEVKSRVKSAGLSCRLIALDWPGHGSSDWTENYSIDLLNTILERFFDAINIEKAHLFGMSLGGIAAIRFAARNQHRVLSVAEQGAPIDANDLAFWQKITLKQIATYSRVFDRLIPRSRKNIDKILRTCVPFVKHFKLQVFNELRKTAIDMELHEIIARDLSACDVRAVFDYAEDLFSLNLYLDLKLIEMYSPSVPFMAIEGKNPELKFLDTMNRIRYICEGDSFFSHEIENVGHFATIINAEEVAEKYNNFLIKIENNKLSNKSLRMSETQSR